MEELKKFGYTLAYNTNSDYEKIITISDTNSIRILVMCCINSYGDEVDIKYPCFVFNKPYASECVEICDDCDLEFVLNLEKLLTKTK